MRKKEERGGGHRQVYRAGMKHVLPGAHGEGVIIGGQPRKGGNIRAGL